MIRKTRATTMTGGQYVPSWIIILAVRYAMTRRSIMEPDYSRQRSIFTAHQTITGIACHTLLAVVKRSILLFERITVPPQIPLTIMLYSLIDIDNGQI